MSKKKDNDIQSPQDDKKPEVNEEKAEYLNMPTDSDKRRPGCNRKKCYCAR
ncbi:hypothetical protein [Pectobacterium versatile]|uniref:hypothetical protein n=1 Tax=Pectobacterium versatile TaxID=2488639 RepID=UPI0020C16AA4|nr:hypothetical protein [Pectobacterium versatile]